MSFIITIDGPAGSGKSSLAKILAKKLNAFHLNTGLLYRAAALLLSKEKIADQLSTQQLEILKKIKLKPFNGQFHIVINNRNVTDLLHTEKLDRLTPQLAKKAELRKMIMKIQRSASKLAATVVDGRDCGTVVFPQADLKFFLTASPKIRAQRIARRNFGMNPTPQQIQNVEALIKLRDKEDRNRAISPLKPANDAFLIDNSQLSLEESAQIMLNKIKCKMKVDRR